MPRLPRDAQARGSPGAELCGWWLSCFSSCDYKNKGIHIKFNKFTVPNPLLCNSQSSLGSPVAFVTRGSLQPVASGGDRLQLWCLLSLFRLVFSHCRFTIHLFAWQRDPASPWSLWQSGGFPFLYSTLRDTRHEPCSHRLLCKDAGCSIPGAACSHSSAAHRGSGGHRSRLRSADLANRPPPVSPHIPPSQSHTLSPARSQDRFRPHVPSDFAAQL